MAATTISLLYKVVDFFGGRKKNDNVVYFLKSCLMQ